MDSQQKILEVERLVDSAGQEANDDNWNSTINISFFIAKEPKNLTTNMDWIDQFYCRHAILRRRRKSSIKTVPVPTKVFVRTSTVQNQPFWNSKLDTVF